MIYQKIKLQSWVSSLVIIVILTISVQAQAVELNPTTLALDIPYLAYQRQEGNIPLWAKLRFVPTTDGRLIWELQDYGIFQGDTPSNAEVTLTRDLTLNITGLSFQEETWNLALHFLTESDKFQWKLDNYATIHEIMNQIISVFENNTPVIQYGYAKVLLDGRGVTAGRAGFTSATGDMLEVINRYTALNQDNPLAIYLPRLGELAKNADGSVIGLEGLESAWQESANDNVFRKVQDAVANEYYYVPATVLAETLGVSLPLTLLNLSDAIIQHGEGDDSDGLPAMINLTTVHVGGTPKNGIDEKLWLQEFMSIRRAVLLNPNNLDTKAEWSASVGRVDTLLELYNGGNFFLELPIVIHPWGDTFTIPIQ